MAGVHDKHRRVPITDSFGKKLFHYNVPRIPEYSRAHPIIPKLYVPEWKTDMPNRVSILQLPIPPNEAESTGPQSGLGVKHPCTWIAKYGTDNLLVYAPNTRVNSRRNARLGNIPTFEHDENLFLEKREQMHYNVENWTRVSEKIYIPPRAELLRPDFHSETSRYQSELMLRRDENAV